MKVPVFWSTLSGIARAGTFGVGVSGLELRLGIDEDGERDPRVSVVVDERTKNSSDGVLCGTDPADFAFTGNGGGGEVTPLSINTLSDFVSSGPLGSLGSGFEVRGAKILSPTPVILLWESTRRFGAENLGDSTRVIPVLYSVMVPKTSSIVGISMESWIKSCISVSSQSSSSSFQK